MSILEEVTIENTTTTTTTNNNNNNNISSSSLVSNTTWEKFMSIISSCSINLFLPFLNGLMLGFGELVAHEYSWKVGIFKRTRENSPNTFKIYKKPVSETF